MFSPCARTEDSFFLAVQDHRSDLYASLRAAQVSTWASGFPECVWYSGNSHPLLEHLNAMHEGLRWKRVSGRGLLLFDAVAGVPMRYAAPETDFDSSTQTLFVRYPDTLLTAGVKFLAALEFFVKSTQSRYFIRTNSSSYFFRSRLEGFLADAPDLGLYSGPIVRAGRVRFAAGSCIILSRDVAHTVLQNRHKWQHWRLEDVALGRLLQLQGVACVPLPSLTIPSPSALDEYSVDQLKSNFHFRCRSIDENGRRVDPEIMLQLHSRLIS